MSSTVLFSTHIYSAIKVFPFLMNVTKKEEEKTGSMLY